MQGAVGHPFGELAGSPCRGLEKGEAMALTLKNSTDFPDAFLRKAIRWICRQLDYPYSNVWNVKLGNSSRCFGGWAFGTHRIQVRIGSQRSFPRTFTWHGITATIENRTEALILVLTHEICHLRQMSRGELEQMELGAEGEAALILEDFRKDREALESAWRKVPERKAKPKPPLVESREIHARDLLTKWERNLKAAQNKVKKYRAKVRYYERRKAARQEG